MKKKIIKEEIKLVSTSYEEDIICGDIDEVIKKLTELKKEFSCYDKIIIQHEGYEDLNLSFIGIRDETDEERKLRKQKERSRKAKTKESQKKFVDIFARSMIQDFLDNPEDRGPNFSWNTIHESLTSIAIANARLNIKGKLWLTQKEVELIIKVAIKEMVPVGEKECS
jgi:hypothetical protein